MLATQPPVENSLATRAAILELAAAKLAPLLPTPDESAALPAWLFSLPAHAIARSLKLDAALCALELARKLEAETARRHPAERFVSYLAEHHPLLSRTQAARLADFAQGVVEERAKSISGNVDLDQMRRRGFSEADWDRLAKQAKALIEAVDAAKASQPGHDDRAPLDRLRAAGELAHARRAFADGDLEIGAAAAATVKPARMTAGLTVALAAAE